MRVQVQDEEQNYPAGALARLAPGLAKAMADYSLSAFNNSRLSLREFEAGRIRTAEINGCVICRNYRSMRDFKDYAATSGRSAEVELLTRGPEPDEALYANILNWRVAENYSPREKIIIELAERMGLDPSGLPYDDDFWDRTKALLSEAEIADATICIGAWMSGGRIIHALGLDSVCAAFPGALVAAN